MEHLREIYNQLEKSKRPALKIDFSPTFLMLSELLERATICRAEGLDIESDHVIKEILEKKTSHRTSPPPPSTEKQDLVNARKIKDINIDEGSIIPYDGYVSGYHNLSFEQFCSYLYWRTQIRRKHFCETPVPYLRLYLIELCNFIEYDSIEETHKALLSLAENLREEKAREKTLDALSVLLLYYGSAEEAKLYITQLGKYNYQRVKDSLSFLNGSHPNPFDFITSRTSHKIKKSVIYQENPADVEKQFLVFFSKVLALLNANGVDLLPLWVGKYALHAPFPSYAIKVVDCERVVEKRFVEDGITFYEVTKDTVAEATMVSYGQDIDPGQCIFNRSYIFNYPMRVFENELRKQTGKRQLKASTEEMRSMLRGSEKPLLEKIIEVYESEAFADCVKQSVQ